MDKLSYEELEKRYKEVCKSIAILSKENRELNNIKMEKLIVIQKYNKLAEDFQKLKDDNKKLMKEMERVSKELLSGEHFEELLETIFKMYNDEITSLIEKKEFDLSFKSKDQLICWINKAVDVTMENLILSSREHHKSNSEE